MTPLLRYLLITVKAIKFEKVSGLFFNTLTAEQKYSLLNRDNLRLPIEMHLSFKRKTFSQLFLDNFEMQIKSLKFSKKKWLSQLIYSRNYALGKPWLNKSLKSSISEDASKGNMVNGSKHCSNLNRRTFAIFIYQCEGN